MAIAHGELHENEQSFFYIQRAAAGAPGDPEAHWMAANVAMMLGKHKRAAEAYERVLQLVPDHAGATDGLVKCMISLGDEARALAMYGEFVSRHALDPVAHAGHAGIAQILGLIPEALATGLCRLHTETMVQRVIVNDQGRATGVSYFDRVGRLQEQPADLVVVCAGATESARLLLNSQSKLFPNGLGNRYDWVGRNLQGHTYTGAMGIFEQEIYDDLGPGASIAVGDFSHGTAGLRGGAVLCNEFIRLPIQAVPVLAPGVPRWGKGHKEFMRSYYKRTVAVQGPTQEMPVWDARVSIDSKVRDKWGIPVPRLSGGKHKHSMEVGEAMSIRAAQWLQAAGAVKTWRKRPGPGLSGGQHQAGTCRMSNDAKTGVVDRYCRIHDTSNVYVVDGSVHVTNGGYNPVLTILALGYWAGSEIVRQRRGGGGGWRAMPASPFGSSSTTSRKTSPCTSRCRSVSSVATSPMPT